VRAWTDNVLHLGCRTTSRVESTHVLVKKYFDNSVGDLGICWEKIHDMLVLQFIAIQTTFGQSVTVLEHRFKDVTLYYGLGDKCLDLLWTILLWKSHVVGEHCAWTRKFVVVFNGHLTGFHVLAKLQLKSVKTSQFYWMRYTITSIGYVRAKKVMTMVFLSMKSGTIFKNVSRYSLTK